VKKVEFKKIPSFWGGFEGLKKLLKILFETFKSSALAAQIDLSNTFNLI
jgi:hypothetical protein